MSSPHVRYALDDLKRAVLSRWLAKKGLEVSERTLRSGLRTMADPVRFRAFVSDERQALALRNLGNAVRDADYAGGVDGANGKETAAASTNATTSMPMWLSHSHRAFNKSLNTLIGWLKRR